MGGGGGGVKYSGADLECLSWIRIFSIPDPWSGVKKVPGSAPKKNLSILSHKIVSKLSEIWSGMFSLDLDLDFLPIPDPRVKMAPDPQHCLNQQLIFEKKSAFFKFFQFVILVYFGQTYMTVSECCWGYAIYLTRIHCTDFAKLVFIDFRVVSQFLKRFESFHALS